MSISSFIALIIFVACLQIANGVVVFQEDFSSSVLPNDTQETFGFFNNNGSFGGIVVSSSASIESGVLEVEAGTGSVMEPGFRGIGIALDSSNFVGAGLYNIEYEISSFTLSSPFGSDFNDSAEVSVFSGSGFELADDARAIILDADIGELGLTNNNVDAEVQQLAIQNIDFSSNTDSDIGTFNLEFTYDGTSAVALFFGARSDGFPFPIVEFDNIEISSVPEPSSVLLAACSVIFLFRRKRF